MVATNKCGEKLKLEIVSGEDALPGAIDCLLHVYGAKENYHNPKVFDKQWMTKKIREESKNLFTAISQYGEPLVTISAKKARYFDKAVELGTLAVNPKYTGFGLGDLIFRHILSECEKAGNVLFFAHVVMVHTMASSMVENHGFTPTGFLLGEINDNARLYKSSRKQSFSVYVKNSATSENATIYVPKYIEPFAKTIYESLSATPDIKDRRDPFGDQCELTYEQDECHKTLYIYISKCAECLREKIYELEQNYNEALQTNIIYLSINDSGAIGGFEILKGMGYKFSGLMPLCGNNEFIIMAKTREVFIDFSELKMTFAQRNLFERIQLL